MRPFVTRLCTGERTPTGLVATIAALLRKALRAAGGSVPLRGSTTTCQTYVIFVGIGQEDAAWVSARLGMATVVGRSANAGRQRSQMLVGQGGYTRGEVGRPLMTPEEIQQMPERSIILAGLHARPVLVRSILWYKSRRLRRLVASAEARNQKPALGMEGAPITAAVEGRGA